MSGAYDQILFMTVAVTVVTITVQINIFCFINLVWLVGLGSYKAVVTTTKKIAFTFTDFY